MKKALAMLAVTAMMILSGCTSIYPNGLLVTDATLPITASEAKCKDLKVGTSTSKIYLGLFSTGDASIATAAKNGGITVIRNVDWKVDAVLGTGTYTCIVYGE